MVAGLPTGVFVLGVSHVRPLSVERRTLYRVMGAPPSSSGGVQESVIDVAVALVPVRPVGAWGFAATAKAAAVPAIVVADPGGGRTAATAGEAPVPADRVIAAMTATNFSFIMPAFSVPRPGYRRLTVERYGDPPHMTLGFGRRGGVPMSNYRLCDVRHTSTVWSIVQMVEAVARWISDVAAQFGAGMININHE